MVTSSTEAIKLCASSRSRYRALHDGTCQRVLFRVPSYMTKPFHFRGFRHLENGGQWPVCALLSTSTFTQTFVFLSLKVIPNNLL